MNAEEKRELNIQLAVAGSEAKTAFLMRLADLMQEHELPEAFVSDVEAELNILATKMVQLLREVA